MKEFMHGEERPYIRRENAEWASGEERDAGEMRKSADFMCERVLMDEERRPCSRGNESQQHARLSVISISAICRLILLINHSLSDLQVDFADKP